MPKLQIIIASTRPTRRGPIIAKWFYNFACQNGKFDIEMVDLMDFNLPVLDEPKRPVLHEYEKEHTKKWAAKIEEGDAYVLILPEYDYYAPASIINALQYLVREWAYKPVGFVSYGGVSGGLRSVFAARSLKSVSCFFLLFEAPPSGPFMPTDGLPEDGRNALTRDEQSEEWSGPGLRP